VPWSSVMIESIPDRAPDQWELVTELLAGLQELKDLLRHADNKAVAQQHPPEMNASDCDGSDVALKNRSHSGSVGWVCRLQGVPLK